MKATKLLWMVMICVVLTSSGVRGQDILPPTPEPVRTLGTTESSSLSTMPPINPGSGGLSDWISYRRPCCEAQGSHVPLATEFYFSAGATFTNGDERLSRNLNTGYVLAGGVRAFFFNEPMTKAYTIDAHIINYNNTGKRNGQVFRLSIAQPDNNGQLQQNDVDVTLREYHRTFVGLGIGREWYPYGRALGCGTDSCGTPLRVGVDLGGRWGSANMEFNEIRHLTDVVGSFYVGIHADLEYPCGPCIFLLGGRVEYSYHWSDVLRRHSEMQDFTPMLTLGVRY